MHEVPEIYYKISKADFENVLDSFFEKHIAHLNLADCKKENEDTLMTRRQVAEYFGITLQTLNKWRRLKLIPAPRKIGGKVMFSKSEIINYKKANK